MEWIATLGRTMGFSFAAGINLYATVAILGLASRYNWVTLPEQYRAFDNDFIIVTALVLYAVEFIADKIPWFDTVWDAVHTAIRPLGGALIAMTTLGEASPGMEVLIALLGGSVAAGTHFSKTGTRAIANTSPEPFSNWILSLGEDAFVVGLVIYRGFHWRETFGLLRESALTTANVLFIIGGKDHLMPPSVQRSNAKKYRNSEALTETYEFPDRSHFTGAEPGWEQVADYALEWATSHAGTRQS